MPIHLILSSDKLPLDWISANVVPVHKKGDKQLTNKLNKNTLGVKKVRGQSEAALQTGATNNLYYVHTSMLTWFGSDQHGSVRKGARFTRVTVA